MLPRTKVAPLALAAALTALTLTATPAGAATRKECGKNGLSGSRPSP